MLVQLEAAPVTVMCVPEPWATEAGVAEAVTDAHPGAVTEKGRLTLASRLPAELASLTHTPMFSVPVAAPVLFQL